MKNIFSTPNEALKAIYGYDDFREGQTDIINAVVEGRDGLAVMKTGGGKSLCFQIPAVCMPGTTIVVSPLIALMKDQVERLNKEGIPAAYVNSSLSAEESIRSLSELSQGKYRLFYVAPERLADPEFRNILKNVEIPFFAIDEAHCISTWGSDFRLAFRKISEVMNELEAHKGKRIPRFAYTATATEIIRDDIKDQLQMQNPFEQVGSFDRANIELNVRESINKTNDVIDIAKQNSDDAIIVYCATVKTATSLHSALVAAGISSGLYHGRLDADVKNDMQEKYLNNEIRVMVATNAFGMGVDKANIRQVIHYHMPGNLENFYQEAGRAGRDGEDSKATLLYSSRDRRLQEFFIETTFPDIEVIKGIQYFLRAFDDGTPITFTYEEMARIAPDNIKPNQVEAILRILEDQGVIKLHSFDVNESSPTVEVLDARKELNLDYLRERKKVVIDNLNIMERFAVTRLCRRDFLLDHFGEKQETKFCGKCDVCHSNMLEQGKISGLLPEDSIRTALDLVKESKGKIPKREIVELLIGAKSRFYTMRKFDEFKSYGALSTYTKSEVRKLVDHLTKSEYLFENERNNNVMLITPKGLELIGSKEPLLMEAPKGLTSIKSPVSSSELDETNVKAHKTQDVFDQDLYEKLTTLRSNLSKIKGVAPFMIYSDTIMKNIAYNKPTNNDGLIALGLTRKKAVDFGSEILTVISSLDKHIEENIQMDVTW